VIYPAPEYLRKLSGPTCRPPHYKNDKSSRLDLLKNKEDTSGQNVLQATAPSYPELPAVIAPQKIDGFGTLAHIEAGG
jgi:hypothetical protein